MLTMAVKLTSVKCPECGANLPIEEGRERLFCSYCGTPVIVTNENEKIVRHIDEAKIKRAETDRVIKYGQLELEKKRIERELDDACFMRKLQSLLVKIWIALVLIIFCICLWFMLRGKGRGLFDASIFIGYVGAPIVAGGGFLIFKVLPDRMARRQLISQGGIYFPKSLEPFDGQDFRHMNRVLKSSGFKNVECINKHE